MVQNDWLKHFKICILFFRPYQIDDIHKTIRRTTLFFCFFALFDTSRKRNFKRLISPILQCVTIFLKKILGKLMALQLYTMWILVSGISQLSHKSSLALLICFSLCLFGRISWRYLNTTSLLLSLMAKWSGSPCQQPRPLLELFLLHRITVQGF